jgi:OOP family OmpA-OmpF porin
MKQNLFKTLPVALAALLIGGSVQAQDQAGTNSNQLTTWSFGVKCWGFNSYISTWW